jgi:hypothetical protein
MQQLLRANSVSPFIVLRLWSSLLLRRRLLRLSFRGDMLRVGMLHQRGHLQW